ncbi:hypothetical protein GCM10029992_37350 [Glycomyces albus]
MEPSLDWFLDCASSVLHKIEDALVRRERVENYWNLYGRNQCLYINAKCSDISFTYLTVIRTFIWKFVRKAIGINAVLNDAQKSASSTLWKPFVNSRGEPFTRSLKKLGFTMP